MDYEMIDQAISQICDIFTGMRVTNVLQTQPQTHSTPPPSPARWGGGGHPSESFQKLR